MPTDDLPPPSKKSKGSLKATKPVMPKGGNTKSPKIAMPKGRSVGKPPHMREAKIEKAKNYIGQLGKKKK